MWPQSLRGRLLVLMVVVVSALVIFSGYLMTLNAEEALLAEKRQKLFGAAKILDEMLIGDYNAILARYGALDSSRGEQIKILNGELAGLTDKVAKAYPGIGVGYYSRSHDAIITYGPSKDYADTVGLPIGENHEGRIVMATGRERVQVGELVRGSIMNAMHPIIRNGQTIGYIWANELTADIGTQIGAMKSQVYLTVILGLVIGIAGIAFVVDRLMIDFDLIKDGLLRLRSDLSYQLPPLPGEVGEIAGAINSMATDLAAKKKLEAQVQRTERLAAIGEVTAGLAHEIRNPLMAIKGFAQLLKEDITPDEQLEYADIIVRETDRMNRLIEQLLCFARPNASALSCVDVNAVAENTLILIETKTVRSHIQVIRSFSANLPKVFVDGEQLKQVLLNILINAVQAVGRNACIEIATELDSGTNTVRVSVKDNGSGIAPEYIAKLFDPFFTTKESGTGLGLSVANSLVENWGGKILVDSTLGVGSKFTVVLPAVMEGQYAQQQ